MITSNQIRAARALLRIDQTSLARDAGISVVTLRRLEEQHGLSKVAPATVDRRFFELCVFTQVMIELKSGDLCIPGSDTYGVRDLFIPDAHAPARDAPEEKRWHGPLYPIGSTLMYATGFCGVTMGVARRMLDTFASTLRPRMSKRTVSPSRALSVARASGEIQLIRPTVTSASSTPTICQVCSSPIAPTSASSSAIATGAS